MHQIRSIRSLLCAIALTTVGVQTSVQAQTWDRSFSSVPHLGIFKEPDPASRVDFGAVDVATCLAVFQDELYIGGRVGEAGGLPMHGLTRFSELLGYRDVGGGVGTTTDDCLELESEYPGLVLDMQVFPNASESDVLFVCGRFDLAGHAAASNIAIWTGSAWIDASAGISLNPSASVIRCMGVADGVLYCAVDWCSSSFGNCEECIGESGTTTIYSWAWGSTPNTGSWTAVSAPPFLNGSRVNDLVGLTCPESSENLFALGGPQLVTSLIPSPATQYFGAAVLNGSSWSHLAYTPTSTTYPGPFGFLYHAASSCGSNFFGGGGNIDNGADQWGPIQVWQCGEDWCQVEGYEPSYGHQIMRLRSLGVCGGSASLYAGGDVVAPNAFRPSDDECIFRFDCSSSAACSAEGSWSSLEAGWRLTGGVVRDIAEYHGNIYVAGSSLYTLTDGSAPFTFYGIARYGCTFNRCHQRDFNKDGNVDADDLGDFITAYFSVPPPPSVDFNGDGSIDPDDLGDFITAYFDTSCS